MKGVIWKYLAKADSELRDGMGRAGCRVLNPDPDFWEHSFPIWAICGPYVRSTLDEGDILFFTPTKAKAREAGVAQYICTGYLTVAEILGDKNDLLRDPRVTARYKQNYQADLRAHFDKKKPTTNRLRSQKIVVGDPEQSKWLGRCGLGLEEVLNQLETKGIDLSSRRVRNLSGEDAARLRSELAGIS